MKTILKTLVAISSVGVAVTAVDEDDDDSIEEGEEEMVTDKNRANIIDVNSGRILWFLVAASSSAVYVIVMKRVLSKICSG